MSDNGFADFADILAQLDHVDDPDVHEKARTNPALAAAYRIVRPRNWLDSGLPADVPPRIAAENGIPVAWVPPPQVLAELASVEPDQRMSVLRECEEIVLDQCAALIEESDDPAVRDAQTLARNAVSAFTEGHHQAAMALAVAVSEGLALWAAHQELLVFDSEEERIAYEKSLKEAKKADEIRSVKYERAEHLFGFLASRKDHSLWLTHWRAVLSPIPRFFTPLLRRAGRSDSSNDLAACDRPQPVGRASERRELAHCDHVVLLPAAREAVMARVRARAADCMGRKRP